ncbi:hypothetical protein P4631_09435 [Halalkalibacterium halodurans]|uniref:hypothetical protein n=2 Tax=Halalkalibacterium halodurans TaxID=86665 RepID=UPI002E1D0E4C|nr:hypothetical protein [Halalkalibacterium halodurans]
MSSIGRMNEHMYSKDQWTRFLTQDVKTNAEKRVRAIEFKLLAENFRGQINITDLQLQAGKFVTGTVPYTGEWLRRKSSTLDEHDSTEGVSEPIEIRGDQPRVFEGIRNRFYNIVGRGHEALAFPNAEENRFDRPNVTTPLDLTLYTKNSFDLLRISTNQGSLLDESLQPYPDIRDHPLNLRYSKEFYFEGGEGGSEIKLHASRNIATLNGRAANRRSRTLPIGSAELKMGQQRMMGLPAGSGRIRIEFYNLVEETVETEWGDIEQRQILRDTGVGYWGVAEFAHWENGRSKL